MTVKRLLLAACLILIIASSGEAAIGGRATPVWAAKSAPWRTFSSKALGVSFGYPVTWRFSSGTAPSKTVVLSFSGRTFYALTVLRLGIFPGLTAQATLQRFISFQKTTAQTNIYARTHWITTSLGGHPASAGVVGYATEGGVRTLSDAVYVSQAHNNVYELIMASYHKPALSKLSQFPQTYRRILASWRWI